MNSKLHNLDRGFRASEITMCLERHVNSNRHPLRNLVETGSDPIPCLLAFRARLNLVRENANQRRTKFRCELSMDESHVHLSRSFTRIYRMKRARSINTTDFNSLAFEILPGHVDSLRSKFITAREIQTSSECAQLEPHVTILARPRDHFREIPVRTTKR